MSETNTEINVFTLVCVSGFWKGNWPHSDWARQELSAGLQQSIRTESREKPFSSNVNNHCQHRPTHQYTLTHTNKQQCRFYTCNQHQISQTWDSQVTDTVRRSFLTSDDNRVSNAHTHPDKHTNKNVVIGKPGTDRSSVYRNREMPLTHGEMSYFFACVSEQALFPATGRINRGCVSPPNPETIRAVLCVCLLSHTGFHSLKRQINSHWWRYKRNIWKHK